MTTEPMNLRSRLQADEGTPYEELTRIRPAPTDRAPRTPPYDTAPPPYDTAPRPYDTAPPSRDVRIPSYDLEGVEEPSDPEGLDARNAQLSAELPPGTALLCVKRTTYAGASSFELYFHHGGTVRAANRVDDLSQRRAPGLGLPSLVELAQQRTWRQAYRHVKGWWRTEAKLADWIDELRAADDPRLVVWDQTAYEIPWELLHRRPVGAVPDAEDDDTGGWIGATLPVVRWTTVYDGARAFRYDARPRRCRGGVLVYEDPEFAVAPDGIGEHEVGQRSTTMEQLHARLRDRHITFGLLLMRCHGTYSEDLEEFTLGDVSLPELSEDWKMPALDTTGAAVLINSCVSARPVEDRRYNGAVPRNFAEIFLRWGAGAVIATVAEVSKVHSHDFAARLVRGAKRGPVNLADELMRHRTYYARRAEQAILAGDPQRAEEAIEGFFASFTYAYFGHPGTTLTLEHPRCGDERGGPEEPEEPDELNGPDGPDGPAGPAEGGDRP